MQANGFDAFCFGILEVMDTQEPSLLHRQAEYWRGVFQPEYNKKSTASPPSVERSRDLEELEAYFEELERIESEFGFDTCSEEHYAKILVDRKREEAEKTPRRISSRMGDVGDEWKNTFKPLTAEEVKTIRSKETTMTTVINEYGDEKEYKVI